GAQGLHISYPRDGSSINSRSTFIIGSSEPGSQVKLNGEPITTNAQGYFAKVVPLLFGGNSFKATADNGSHEQKSIVVKRPAPGKPLGPSQWKIISNTLEPQSNRGIVAGDLILFRVHATPQSSISVKLDNRVIQLSPAQEVRSAASAKKRTKLKSQSSPKSNVNFGLAVAYGKIFQQLPRGASDLYVGFYKVQSEDNFKDCHPEFTLTKDNRRLALESPARITVVKQPYLAQTIHDETVVRVAPGAARLTPLSAGVRLLIDGWSGNEFRCLYGQNKHVYIDTKDLIFEKGHLIASGPPPQSRVQTINIARDSYGDAVLVPLNQRLPFDIEQSMTGNKLNLKIFGAVADTDFVSQEFQEAFEGKAEGSKEGSKEASVEGPVEGPVEGINWRQSTDDIYEVEVKLRGNRQWGYYCDYNGNNLILHIKRQPHLVNGQPGLQGLRICVDPGHGGAQPGATGCSGVTEKAVNLAIALKLKQLLEESGATVVMTRTDDRDIDLYDRVRLSRSSNCDILLSVHNNSLPDGRDPNKEHGTSTYFYNPQAKELAGILNSSLVKGLGFPNIGARYQNLALTRPTSMVSVLVEIGFMINPDEYARLLDDTVQHKAAQALLDGLKTYLRGK
ncbi:MAG: N-acetylmuramoyl-L-alanine amidase, partial [Candidatus Obscuribacterales bacterium]|nr:N-acetylmuramoyl-L-alanine amidase [Candidatus Obscuribacterales bacterium]